ncbi:Hypothetical_protein [Hexamita inflata]|uniref:Hypothetical_protein n=1 Tax=Hexamita inflata TaxID=28002 RepID=A0ABP1I7M9_9EUKA
MMLQDDSSYLPFNFSEIKLCISNGQTSAEYQINFQRQCYWNKSHRSEHQSSVAIFFARRNFQSMYLHHDHSLRNRLFILFLKTYFIQNLQPDNKTFVLSSL